MNRTITLEAAKDASSAYERGPLLLFIRSLSVGGAERQLIELAKALHAGGRDVRVMVFYAGGALEQELHRVGIPVIDLGKQGRWQNFRFFLRLIRTLRRVRPHALYSFLVVANILGALARPFAPSIKVVWGVRASARDWSQYDWMTKLSQRIEARLSRFADVIICNSQAGRNFCATNGFPSTKTKVVPNGIDTVRFAPSPEQRHAMRRRWKIADDAIVVGIVGRLDPVKDHHNFLQAAARLSMHRPDLRFLCIGGGPDNYRARLAGQADALGLRDKIIWTGPQQDMGAILNALDICCSSSVSEGFPNAIAEAMACGVPCVVTDVGDSAMIVGETGLAVPPADPEALAEALKAMIPRLGPELTQLVRGRIMGSFSISAMAAATASLIDSN